jgi:hypothetical protein
MPNSTLRASDEESRGGSTLEPLGASPGEVLDGNPIAEVEEDGVREAMPKGDTPRERIQKMREECFTVWTTVAVREYVLRPVSKHSW